MPTCMSASWGAPLRKFDGEDFAGGLQIGNKDAISLFDWPSDVVVVRCVGGDFLLHAALGVRLAAGDGGAGCGEELRVGVGVVGSALCDVAAEVLDFAADFVQFVLHRRAGLGDDLAAGLFDVDQLVAQVGFDDLGVAFAGFCLLQHLLGVLAGAADVLQHSFHCQGFRAHDIFGSVDDGGIQAEAAGDGEGVGATWQTDAKFKGGAEVFDIELDGGVEDAGGIVGIEFEVAVMGGGEGGDAAVAQIFEEGDGEGGTFIGVGAGAEFVEEDEAMGVGFFEDADDVGHVAGEGAEILFDRLFVADVGVDAFEDGEFAALVDGYHHAGLGHQGEEADGFESDGFAAGVGAGHDEGEAVVAEIDVDGDNAFRFKQRVTGLAEVQDGTGVLNGARFLGQLVDAGEDFVALLAEGDDMGGGCFQLIGVPGLGKGEIELGEDLDVAVDVMGFIGDEIGEFGEDAAQLFLLLQLQLADGVVLLYDSERLDEEGCAAGGLVVDDALDAGFVL